LNLAGSYVSGGPPNGGGTNTILIDGAFTQSRTAALGANIAVAGITQDATADFQFQISNTAGAVLTIGSGGVIKASTINSAGLIFANAVTLGANQTWTIAGGGTGNNLQMNGAFSDGGRTLAVTGAGTFDLRGTNTFGSNVTIDTTVSVNGAGATVTLGGANTMNTLNIPSGRVIGATLNNFGVASNFGDGGTNTAIALGNTTNGIMEYSGNTATSNRTVNRDARSAASGIDVTTSGQTLTLSGKLGSGSLTNAGTNGWVFGGAGNLTLNGVISNAIGAGSTGTTITKNGGGTLTLGSATNSYTGATAVKEGTLLIGTSGSLANTAVTVGGAGTTGTPTLGGGGMIGGATTIAAAGGGVVGIHSVGAAATGGADGVGKQTFSSSITYETGSIFEWNLAATPSETGRGTSYDAVNATSLGSTTGAIFRVVLNDTQDFTSNWWDSDRTWSDIFKTGDLGSNLNIASIFSGTVEYYNGGGTTLASISAPTTQGAFTFSGTDLKWTAVPEPTSALAGLLIAAGLLRRRRSI
jgi:autotransporter-associated beta strand protein